MDLEANLQQRRESVGEVANAEGSDQTAEVSELGYRGCDDESEGPVDGNDNYPEDLALLVGERGEVYSTVLESIQLEMMG